MIGSVAADVEYAISELHLLGQRYGPFEHKFEAYLEGAGGLWKSDVLQVKGEDDDSDLAAHGTDRKQICADMAGSFQVRYSTALSDPRLAAFRVFEHRKWPAHEAGIRGMVARNCTCTASGISPI